MKSKGSVYLRLSGKPRHSMKVILSTPLGALSNYVVISCLCKLNSTALSQPDSVKLSPLWDSCILSVKVKKTPNSSQELHKLQYGRSAAIFAS